MSDTPIDKEAKNSSETSVRSFNSDLEVVPSSRKRRGSKNVPSSPLSQAAEKTNSNRPANWAFTQQKMYGWQPILTPYNVLPVLFILGIVFVPLGAVFLSASFGVKEFTFDYSTCTTSATNTCEATFTVAEEVKGPVYVYYRLSNYYQNNRLYAKSFSQKQLSGEAVSVADLASACDPLVHNDQKIPYYPCGLIANSYFSDIFSDFQLVKDASGADIATPASIPISSKGIAWPADKDAFGESKYKVEDVVYPTSWEKFPEELKQEFNMGEDGMYTKLPNLKDNERFINWMKIAGLPTFRKLYGRIDQNLAPGTYQMKINSNYDVQSFKGTKSVVLSTTTWAGGKNSALGWSFVIIGGVLLLLGIFFLAMFMLSPRKVGDVTYLSWYNENLGDIPVAND